MNIEITPLAQEYLVKKGSNVTLKMHTYFSSGG
jgi:hypothetical protein